MASMLIIITAFVGVTALVGGGAMLFRSNNDTTVEDRLAMLTGSGPSRARIRASRRACCRSPLDGKKNVFDIFFARFKNFTMLFEQADTSLTLSKFLMISGVLGMLGMLIPAVLAIAPGVRAGCCP